MRFDRVHHEDDGQFRLQVSLFLMLDRDFIKTNIRIYLRSSQYGNRFDDIIYSIYNI